MRPKALLTLVAVGALTLGAAGQPVTASTPAGPRAATDVADVSGQVLEQTGGTPIAGASVHASRTDRYAITDAQGRFTLTGVPETSALVVAAKEGYAFASTARDGSTAVTLRLARDTSPARSEYPRPDADRRPFTGDAWLGLNGTWSFDFDPQNVGESQGWFQPNRTYSKAIRVPFAYQSLAAWGEEQLAANEVFRGAFAMYRGTVWYRRTFTMPDDFAGRNALLRIGAADWGAAVWLDGRQVASYGGDGVTEIGADLGTLEPGSTHTLAIRVVAPKTTPESPYPMGKQTGVPNGENTGWFTDIGGIWQSVWLEPADQSRIVTAKVTPQLAFTGTSRTPSSAGAKLEIAASSVGALVASAEVTIRDPGGATVQSVPVRLTQGKATTTLPIPNPQLWEPSDPKLYTVDIRTNTPNGVDGVRTTFGLRKIERRWAPGATNQYQYVYLNNRPIYIRGVLDQAYNPWGIYTATGVTAGPDLKTGTEAEPGRGSMLRDLEEAKRLGFNVVRLHVKVNEPAYYHLADKLGLMVWYDFPNAGWQSLGDEAKRLFEQMLRNTLNRDHNHPSIIFWSIFNESWGLNQSPWGEPISPAAIPYVKNMVAITRSLDTSRLVVDNSPCCLNGHVDTDINDFHYYLNSYDEWKGLLDQQNNLVTPGSKWNFNDGAQSGQPWMNSEFGVNAGQFPHAVSLFRSYAKNDGYVGVQLAETEGETPSQITYDRQPNPGPFVDHTGARRGIDLFQGEDAVSLMGPATVTLGRGEFVNRGVRLSHFSDTDLSGATLHWKVSGYTDGGLWKDNATSGSRAVSPARYTVSDAGSVSVQAPYELQTGYLWVWVEAGGRTVAENYLTFDTNPFLERGGGSFKPSQPTQQAWTGGFKTVTANGSDSITGYGRGYAEYQITVPPAIQNGTADRATLTVEVASAQPGSTIDPLRITAARQFPTSLTVSVNGQNLPAVQLPDDPDEPTALAGRAHTGIIGSFGTNFGYRLAIPVTAAQLGDGDRATLRLTSNGGGLSIFGLKTGKYGRPPLVLPGVRTLPDERPTARAVDTRLSVYQSPAAIPATTGSGQVIVSVVNDTGTTARDVKISLAGPAGWTIQPVDATTIASLAPGAHQHVAFTVRPPSSTPGLGADLTATASWANGDGRSAFQAIARSTVS